MSFQGRDLLIEEVLIDEGASEQPEVPLQPEEISRELLKKANNMGFLRKITPSIRVWREYIEYLIHDDDYNQEKKFSVDDLGKLLMIVDFLTGDFPFQNVKIFDLDCLPAAEWIEHCYQCSNTSPEEQLEYFLRYLDFNIQQFLTFLQGEIGELSAFFQEYIRQNVTEVFKEHTLLDCVAYDNEDQSLENINNVDFPQTQFRFLVTIFVKICDNI